jgi:hypothetical protein
MFNIPKAQIMQEVGLISHGLNGEEAPRVALTPKIITTSDN